MNRLPAHPLSAVSRFLAVFIILTTTAALHAQLPTDNAVWKDRCNAFTNASKYIAQNPVPSPLLATTKGVPARDFFVLAVNRAQNGQHWTACTLYYLAAISEQAGIGAPRDPLASSNDAVVAGSEWKLAQHHHLRMHEHVVRMKLKVEELKGQPLTLTPDQTTAAINAADTVPISF